MPIDHNQNIQQAVLVPGSAIRPGQKPVQLELFDMEGAPVSPGEGSAPDLSDYPTTAEVQQMIDNALAANP